MGKYEKKRERRPLAGIILALALVIVFASLALLVIPQFLHSLDSNSDIEDFEQNAESQTTTAAAQTLAFEDEEPQPPDSVVTFPIVLEEGKLEVESMFQFSGINPDADRQEATDVAAVVIRNNSDVHLMTATVTAVLGDGSERIYVVHDLPAGKSAMVFSVDNDKLSASDVCADISVESVFEDIENNDGIKVSVDGMTVTLENISGETLSGIDVYCRDVFNDQYFGGVAYKYTVEELAADESTTVTVVDSIMGITEVVRIVVNDQK